ncbi:MAG TPA: hypothetical protein VLJ10_05330 [Candidatus Bathyarchaeia archaeon]|nr:hypothetical protein [Candidatus Bathyarchaeia archaeon]
MSRLRRIIPAIPIFILTTLLITIVQPASGKTVIDPDQSTVMIIAQTIGDHDGSFSGWSSQKVKVLKTLSGANITGDNLWITAKDTTWKKGTDYILTIEIHGIGETATTMLLRQIEAIPENITAVTDQSSPRPKDILWVILEAGWGMGIIEEFRVDDHGAFTWRKATEFILDENQRTFTRKQGILPAEKISELITLIQKSPEGPVAKDAGRAVFTWRDNTGNAQSKSYSLPQFEPCAEIFAQIERYTKNEETVK